MKDIAQSALEFISARQPFVMATVIRTWGSAPRKAGSHMIISDHQIIGSVSGGCLEGDIARRAVSLLGTRSGEFVSYGVSDDEAWSVGLSCGGEIDILLESFDPDHTADLAYWRTLSGATEEDREMLILHPLTGNAGERAVLTAEECSQNGEWKKILDSRQHAIVDQKSERYFVEVVRPQQRLIIIGAVHIANALVVLAKRFGFHTTVIDPRGFFNEKSYFEQVPDVLHSAWPAEILEEKFLTQDAYAVILSHDPKIDDQALEILLHSDVGYIGALGSRKTHAKRLERLKASGFPQELTDRIHAPIGLDINAQTAEEIALSIVAELIMVRNKG